METKKLYELVHWDDDPATYYPLGIFFSLQAAIRAAKEVDPANTGSDIDSDRRVEILVFERSVGLACGHNREVFKICWEAELRGYDVVWEIAE